jgi:hypothetical protein
MHIVVYAYILCYPLPVKHKNRLPLLPQPGLEKLLPLWPALKGSLAEVYKPCIRPNCQACASGKKHPNYLLAFTEKGKRRCLYVPKPMVPILKRALENGRRLEQLLYEMGPTLLHHYRKENPANTGPGTRRKRSAHKKRRTKS